MIENGINIKIVDNNNQIKIVVVVLINQSLKNEEQYTY